MLKVIVFRHSSGCKNNGIIEGNQPVSLEKMDALEVRVRRLVDRMHDLRQANQSLQQQLVLAKEELSKRESGFGEWEAEREHIKARIEKVLGELDGLESSDADLEEVANGKAH